MLYDRGIGRVLFGSMRLYVGLVNGMWLVVVVD